MNKKILISLSVIGIVAAIAVGGTIAYFSDTETSQGNTFTAGVIDISINDENPWEEHFTLDDMKPCYTDYITFRINNDGNGANPVDIYKKLVVQSEDTGTVTEPECTDQNGTWNGTSCEWNNNTDNNDLSSVIWYDLYVEVYDADGNKIWWQTIYTDDDHKSIDDIYGNDGEVYLGMIPAGGYMLVVQSYHLKPEAGNEFQGDIMTFDIQIKGEQLHQARVLENKEGAEPWKLILGDGIQGTLTYKVKSPTFDFTFSGKAPLANHKYYLIAGGTPSGSSWDPDTEIASFTTDGNGNFDISGNVELNKDLKDAKVWAVPEENWNGTEVTWSNWPGCVTNFLWETGLIWYEDTDN
ncbi:hypothetical protein J7K24_02985 [bacterium]|nr:hypothetical protein [bacterium]